LAIDHFSGVGLLLQTNGGNVIQGCVVGHNMDGTAVKKSSSNSNLVSATDVSRTSGDPVGTASTVSLHCSRIQDNAKGILVRNAATGVVVNDNIIAGNTLYGVQNVTASVVNAEMNYWGSADGPSNLGGSGDGYDGDVDADPFRSSPPPCALENTAPVIDSFSTDSPGCGGVMEGHVMTISASFVDPDLDDTLTATILWGDGTSSSSDSGEVIISSPNDAGSISASHAYAEGGIYTVTVLLSDGEASAERDAPAVIVGAGVHDGVLQVIGTNGADHVTVVAGDGGLLEVHTDYLETTDGNKAFAAADVTQIEMVLCAGDDHGVVSSGISLPAMLDGAAGDDKLTGGSGYNTILGGDGDDVLVGGNTRDILIGGTGADRMVGKPEDDILIAGVTTYERLLDYSNFVLYSARNAALEAILAEWTSTRSLAARKANLMGDEDNPGFANRANDHYFLKTAGDEGDPEIATVFNDDAKDVMTGSSGVDWFFANLEDDEGGVLDKITDLHDDEFADDLEFIESEAPMQSGPVQLGALT
jgi:Ca2+-binding RTX toxin-like protein